MLSDQFQVKAESMFSKVNKGGWLAPKQKPIPCFILASALFRILRYTQYWVQDYTLYYIAHLKMAVAMKVKTAPTMTLRHEKTGKNTPVYFRQYRTMGCLMPIELRGNQHLIESSIYQDTLLVSHTDHQKCLQFEC